MIRFIAVLFLAFVLPIFSADAGQSDPLDKLAANPNIGTSLYDADEHNSRAVLRYLVPILNEAGKAGRIYYTAACPPNAGFVYPFPKLDIHRPVDDASGLDAVRQIFSGNSDVKVDEYPNGVINIQIGKIPDELLKTKISEINFDSQAQYDDRWALVAIMSVNEIQAAEKKIGISPDTRPKSWLGGGDTDKNAPYLPPKLTNTTLDDALDLVATTFQGIMFYGLCADQTYVRVELDGGPRSDPLFDEMEQAISACKKNYLKTAGHGTFMFGAIGSRFIHSSRWAGHFEITGSVSKTDITGGHRSEEQFSCNIPLE